MKTLIITAAAAVTLLSGCVGYAPGYEPGYGAQPVYRNDAYRNDAYRNEARGNRDRDRDGIPNRVDRDRDGDGVPNRYDNRPNNPNR